MDTAISLTLFIIFLVFVGILFVIKSTLVVCPHCGEKHSAGYKIINTEAPGKILFRDFFACNKKRLWFYRDIWRDKTTPANSDTPWIMTFVNPVSDRAIAEALKLYPKNKKEGDSSCGT